MMQWISLILLVIVCSKTKAKQSFDKRFCKDEKSYSTCNFWNRLGACKYESYYPMLAELCPKTCNLCTFGLEEKPDNCNDKRDIQYCRRLKEYGACENHADLMAESCANTCNLCDAKRKCAKKTCEFNEVCVLDEKREPQCTCPRYCANKFNYEKLGKICGSDGKTYANFCDLQHQACKDNNNITVTKYGYCDKDIPCEDRDLEKKSGMCDQWKEMDLCGSNFGGVMRKYCKRTCGYCDKRVSSQRLRGECDDKSKSPFGCCWDLSFRRDPQGHLCPECRDKYEFCSKFIDQCNMAKNHAFMKQNCAVTCGYCTPSARPKLVVKLYYENGKRLLKTMRKSNIA